MTRVDLNALRVFAVLAEHGSFQRPTTAVNLSRRAVSQRIAQLGLDLGVVLTHDARGMSLTRAEERCRAAMNDALAILETALVEIGRTEVRITPHLGPSFAAKCLAPRAVCFAARFPDISLATGIRDRMPGRNPGRNEIALRPEQVPDPNPAHHAKRLTELRLAALCIPHLVRPDGPMEP